MIKHSNCEYCEGYVVVCSRCARKSTGCSNDDEGNAALYAKSIGWITVYPTVASPAIWVCKFCK